MRKPSAVVKWLCQKAHLPTDITKFIGAQFEFHPTELPKPQFYAGTVVGVELYDGGSLLLHVKTRGLTKHETDKVKHAILFDPKTRQ